MSERMSDSFIISLPWSDSEFTEITELVQRRRANTSRLFLTFLILCCLTYLTTDGISVDKEPSPPHVEDGDGGVNGVVSMVDGTQTTATSGTRSLTSMPIKIFLCVFTIGFVAMFLLMNKLKWIERQLDCRIERNFGVGGGHQRDGRSDEDGGEGGGGTTIGLADDGEEMGGDSPLVPLGLASIPGGWELGGSPFQPSVILDWERLSRLRSERRRQISGNARDSVGRPHGGERRGVSQAAKDQWTRFLVNRRSDHSSLSENDVGDVASQTSEKLPLISTASSPEDESRLERRVDVLPENQQKSDTATSRAGKSYSGYGSMDNRAIEVDATNGQRNNDDGWCTPVQAGSVCSICLSEYDNGEKAVKLPCGHVYHEDCVAVWVSNHIRCPLCNYNLEEGSPL